MPDKKNKQLALKQFDQGFNCAQSVFATFSEQLQLDKNTALKIASGFGGGLGRRGDECGVVTGAMMVLGLAYGNTAPKDDSAKDLILKKTNEFARRFKEINDSSKCQQLIGFNLADESEHKAAVKNKVFDKLCTGYISDAVKIIEDLL